MIHYDPHKWLDHFFDIRGSLVKEISVRVGVCVLWSVGVVAVHKYWFPVGMSSLLHTLMGLALGLLLVFRTSSSYDRFWEGRKLWGGIVNETRNLVRGAVVHFPQERDLVVRITQLTGIFPWGVIYALRGGEVCLGPYGKDLGEKQVAELSAAQHPALAVAREMTACLREAHRRGAISDIVMTNLDTNIQQLVDFMGGCERIRKTPMPFAYAVHLRRLLVLYCLSLPFAMVDTFGWVTVADVLLLSYTFFGIEEIGVEIEGPFGHDENDLPLEDISETIHKNLYALAGIDRQEREALPEGL